ncbi:MAG: hypothetical protein FWG03_01955, partial [Clostridiales bacterium]|nr:hypothetical protein [Clostridiales bacterium]
TSRTEGGVRGDKRGRFKTAEKPFPFPASNVSSEARNYRTFSEDNKLTAAICGIERRREGRKEEERKDEGRKEGRKEDGYPEKLVIPKFLHYVRISNVARLTPLSSVSAAHAALNQ